MFPTKYTIKVSEANFHIRYSFCIYEHGFLQDSGCTRSRRLGVCGGKKRRKGEKGEDFIGVSFMQQVSSVCFYMSVSGLLDHALDNFQIQLG